MELFSDWAIAQMVAGFTWAGKSVGVALLTALPRSATSASPQGVDDLLAQIGYQEQVDPDYERATALITSVTSGDVINVVLGENIDLPADVEPAFIVAAVYFVVGTHAGETNPWLFISDRTFGRMVFGGSEMTAVDDTLFSYVVRGSSADAVVGALQRTPGIHPWEPPRVQHVYLYPQRVNWVPNPSFEDVGNFGWRSDGTITRTVGGVDVAANFFGAIDGERLESAPVRGASNGEHRVSAYVRSQGATKIQVGLLCYQIDWGDPSDSLGPETRIVEDDWMRVDALVTPADVTAGLGFLAVADGPFDIDLVLVEGVGDLNDYFDGDSTTGFIGDFSWQGVTHQSLSFWYNNRFLVGARLFGEYTEGLVTKRGLVYDWVPESTAIYTHWDILAIEDTRQPIPDWPSAIIP
jgi:hypothetical protein